MFKPSFEKLKAWYMRYERHISSAALIAGFVVDSVTLKRIDLLFENLILLTHLTVVLLGIIIVNFYEGGVLRGRVFGIIRSWAPLFMQFSFGALFSGFLIFYSRSASLAASWPFLLFLVFLLIGNEFFKARYQRFVFQMSIFYIALFSFSIFYVPVIVGTMGAGIFLLSGAVSILVIGMILFFLGVVIPKRVKEDKKALTMSIGSIFLIINILYFTNIIPPIPLSLKEAGAYHFVERTETGVYLARAENEEWYAFLLPYNTLHLKTGDEAYVYSAVFAPTNLNTNIVHEWQYFNVERDSWVTASRVSFSIVGGRDGGYRGYSLKKNIFPGQWRVNIETERGQLVGRVKLKVVDAKETLPPLHEKVL